MKGKIKRILSAFLAFLLLFSAMPEKTFAETVPTCTKMEDESEFVSGKYILVTDTGYAPGVVESVWITAVPITEESLATPPAEAVCDITVDAENKTAVLKLSDGNYVVPKGGNSNGLGDGTVQYQWDYSFGADGKIRFAGTGADTVYFVSNKSSQSKFKGYKTSTVDGQPNGYPSFFTLYKVTEENGGKTAAVAAPTASPQAGAVEEGTKVTLTTTTAGAQIYYTLDGSDPSDEENVSRVLYAEDTKPEIQEDCTLQAVAVLDGETSALQSLSYTIKSEITDPSLEELPIQDGDMVVIYAPAYNKALSADKVSETNFYNKGVDVSFSGESLSGYTAKEVWTVKDNGDDTWSFSNGDQNIGMAEQYASMNLGAVNDKWKIIALDNGTFNIQNTVRNFYMEWYNSKSNWSTYNSSNAATDNQFQLAFYKVTEIPVTPDPGTDIPDTPKELEIVASPKNGASVTAGQKITLTAAKGVEIYYTITTDGTVPANPDVTDPNQKYTDALEIAETPTADKPVMVKAIAYVPATETVEEQKGEVYTFTYKAPVAIGDKNLYFGQLHAHTNLSDGTGSVAQAFDHASKVENLDFLAVTDHSNSFDGASETAKMHLGDAEAESVSKDWAEGRQSARDINARENGTFIGIYGFEMTWSGGSPGHINTFNSKGFESRNLTPYKKGDNYAVLQAYYDTLNKNPETISQFNHPGDTFGDFMDFALYDPVIDNQMTLIEVGNGEGAIGASGYFPSYSYYTRALDKGWHVAPTNNQDNHKGNWGDSNTARSVVLADNLSEESIYDAMKNYRVYATEDNDLSILYSLNGYAMGSILDKQETVNISAVIKDPTDTTGKTKVEVIVNGGQTLAQQTFDGGSAEVNFDNLPATYGYYYLRITQADKNIAVTAPVWVGESLNAGISNTASDVALPVKGDEIHISSQIFNNRNTEMQIKSLTYTMEGDTEPFHTVDVTKIGDGGVIASRGSFSYAFPYTLEQAGGFNVNVELKAIIEGEEYTFTDVLKLSVADPSIVTKVLIDGTHYNDYVNGYYSGNMSNFINMGISDNIQVKITQPGQKITADMLKDVSLFVISAPLKYTSEYTGDAVPSVFEDDFVSVVKDYVTAGGTVIVCGLADYQDSNNGSPYTSYEQANKILAGIGSTMRINDDELLDQDNNGGQPYRLYFDDFNYGSSDPVVQTVLKGVKESGLTYSSYSGCSVDVGNGEAIVKGHDTTYSINSKAPALGHNKPVSGYKDAYNADNAVVEKGNVVSMATEAVGKGRVFACGTVFCSNFEVSAEDQVSYSNGIIAQNILNMVKIQPEISTILEARAGKSGEVFTVTGTVANGTAEEGNAFFNTIYIQDENGNGINVFPIDDNSIRRGDQVQITGSVSEYIGDKQLSAIKVSVLDGSKNVVISEATTKEANDYDKNFGKLVRVKGSVCDVKIAGDVVESITLLDNSGESCRVFIDGYIGYSDKNSKAIEQFVKTGAQISAVGFVSHDAEGNRLRVRDRSEITLISAASQPNPEPNPEPNPGTDPGTNPGTGTETNSAAEPINIADKAEVTVDEGDCVYDGTAKQPAVTVSINGTVLVSGADYIVNYENNVNAGTAKAIISGQNNYTGTVTEEFIIEKADKKIEVKNSIVKEYGSKAFSLGAKTVEGEKLAYVSSDRKVVTVDAKGKVTVKGIGKASITITAGETANYNEAVEKVAVTVQPKKAKLSSIASKKAAQMTVEWKKDTKVSGYQITYSTSKKFSKAKSVIVKSNKTTSKTISNLSKGKTYYVKVRSYKTVKGKKIYGYYSSVRKVKIKK